MHRADRRRRVWARLTYVGDRGIGSPSRCGIQGELGIAHSGTSLVLARAGNRPSHSSPPSATVVSDASSVQSAHRAHCLPGDLGAFARRGTTRSLGAQVSEAVGIYQRFVLLLLRADLGLLCLLVVFWWWRPIVMLGTSFTVCTDG